MPQNYELKPYRPAFLYYKLVFGFFMFLIFFLGIYFAVRKILVYPEIILLSAFFTINIFNYIILSVKYRKERYIFQPNKIIRKGGSIFSDFEVELNIKNITHVKMALPFIPNKLFSVGNIKVESAGTSAAEIYLSCIYEPKGVYDYIEELLKYNGFKATKSKLMQKERPSSLGVFFEVFSSFIGTIAFIVFMALYAGEVLFKYLADNMPILMYVSGTIIFLLLIRAFFQFFDLRSREYEIYSDAIIYSEGFLTKNYALIPMENLSDSTLTQTFVDKLFGLYDVKISCQGSNHEILFKNIINGPKLEETIDKLIPQSKSVIDEKEEKVAEAGPGKAKKAAEDGLSRDTLFAAEYRMDLARTIVPLLVLLPICIILLPFLLFWIIYFLTMIVKASFTKYIVKGSSIEQKFDFLTKKNTEFTTEKITGIVLKESFIDAWFKTCSIQFWSIGSSESIEFSNIKKEKGLYESILAKTGIKEDEIIYSIDSKFSFIEMLRSNLLATFVSAAALLVSFILMKPHLYFIPILIIGFLYICAAIYSTIFYNRSRLKYYRNYVFFKKGIFFVEKYYVLYGNVKNVKITRYPFSKSGSIYYDVSGEHIVQQGKNQQLVSNSFSINYVKDIETKNTLIDMIFYIKPDSHEIENIEKEPEKFRKTLFSAKPQLGNYIFPLILISIIIFPLIVFLPITIPLVIINVKAESYVIEPHRILKKYGIFYKKQVSILFRKVDHINTSQGMVNKMFGNGNITINTVGSSMTEMTISSIKEYEEFYKKLKEQY